MSAKFKDYVEEVEASLSDKERAWLDTFRVRDQALADFDRLAAQAAERLSYRLWGSSDPLIVLARQRMVEGFDLYPAGPMFEWDDAQLEREANEELADAIVYTARQLALEELDQPSH